MGLLEKVADAHRGRSQRARKSSWSEPSMWDYDQLRYPFLGSTSLSSDREQIENDFEGYAAGIAKRNGPIFALMMVRQLVFSEARFAFRRIRNGRPGDLFGTQALAPLERPWANGTTGDLLSRMIQDVDLAGNAFVARRRDGTLRRLRPDWVTIISASKSEPELYGAALDAEVIGYYYSPRSPGSATDTLLLPSEVAHFAPIPDPEMNWRGMSWLTPVLREISADSAATKHKLAFFENSASPRIAVMLDAGMTKEAFARFKAIMDDQHQGVDNAWKTLYIGGGADVKPMTMSMRDLDYKSVQALGESRLAAAAGVPSAIVGFSEGMQGSSLNAGNFGQARRRFADGTLRPLWRNAAGSLASLIEVPSGAELWYDDRDIAFLREDKKDSAEIFQIQVSTIGQAIRDGHTPESARAAVAAQDLDLLKHSGLVSVQLQPPGTVAKPASPEPTDQPPAGGQDAPPDDPSGPDPAEEQ